MEKNKYLVTICEELYTTYVVEAEDQDEASDLAMMGEYVSIDDAVSKNNEVILVDSYNE